MKINVKALTPIWTGDANRVCRRILETGIIGSLRWWYEVMIRGFDLYACDPTDSKCEEERHCHACQLFGCTGWAKRFRLEITEQNGSFAPFVIAKPNGSSRGTFLGHYDSQENYENNGGFIGEIDLKITPLSDSKIDILNVLIKFACDWGFGSRTQVGFGIADVEGLEDIVIKDIPPPVKTPDKAIYRLSLPRLDKFFFARIPIKSELMTSIKDMVKNNIYCRPNAAPLRNWNIDRYLPTAPWVRKSLREIWRENDVLRHILMGFISILDQRKKRRNPSPIHLKCWQHSVVKDKQNKERWFCAACKKKNLNEGEILEKTGSLIHVSHIYNRNTYFQDIESVYEMKIWGYIPEITDELSKSREHILKEIKEKIWSEDFWRGCFGLDQCPIQTKEIKWCDNVSVQKILQNKGIIL
ncbi:MAG: type III-B CRISPR module RAMP protein Cmr1 [Deltaproteobacteria bacterium]|nr:type III-B CRISPR module RAMP protein Cmr1 [Deltaproteobacteria bacterium]